MDDEARDNEEEEHADEGRADQVAIRVPPELEGGVWANFAAITHSPYEFTLDFVRMTFDGAQPRGGVLVQRVNMPPLFVQQLIDALGDNWKKYADKAMPREIRE